MSSESNENYALWLQLSERFSSKRLSNILVKNVEKLNFVKEHTLISPEDGPCKNYEDQCFLFKEILSPNFYVPDLKFIVLDNISHHLRYELSKYNDIKNIVSLKNNFFQSYLFPLMMMCERREIILILIHEATYVPILYKNKPFNYKLYDKIDDLLHILMKEDEINSGNYFMQISNTRLTYNLNYLIKNEGFIWKFLNNKT